MPNPAWVKQQLDRMVPGIVAGKTRKRNRQSALLQNATEQEMAAAAHARGWRMAQIGNDYVFAPGNYVIRPIV